MHVNSEALADKNQLKCEKVRFFKGMNEINSSYFQSLRVHTFLTVRYFDFFFGEITALLTVAQCSIKKVFLLNEVLSFSNHSYDFLLAFSWHPLDQTSIKPTNGKI